MEVTTGQTVPKVPAGKNVVLVRTRADFASRPEIRKMLWHFHGFSARSLPGGINPPGC